MTFIPSRFGSAFTPDEKQLPAIQYVLSSTLATKARAKELGVGITMIRSGIFVDFFFGMK